MQLNKHERISQCSHNLYTHLHSWRKMMQNSLECRLIATMLEGQRGSKASVRTFLRIRREITKNNIMELLDEIFLVHCNVCLQFRGNNSHRAQTVRAFQEDIHHQVAQRFLRQHQLQASEQCQVTCSLSQTAILYFRRIPAELLLADQPRPRRGSQDHQKIVKEGKPRIVRIDCGQGSGI